MKAIHLKGCIQEHRSEWGSRSIKNVHRCHICLFLAFFTLFSPFHSISYPCCIPLVVISLPPLLFYSFSLCLSVSVVAFSAAGPHPLIDSVDATQFCTVQCAAILLQWTPVSWYINKTPLCSEWNVPSGGRGALSGLIYSVGWLIPSFQQHGVDEGGGKCIDVKQCI